MQSANTWTIVDKYSTDPNSDSKYFFTRGTGFSADTGVFTAPLDGIYLFTAHVHATDMSQATFYVNMRVNNVNDVKSGSYAQTSNVRLDG